MKILYLCNYFQPMNYGENEISQSLVKLGHSVVIVTGDKYFPFPNYVDTVGKILGKRQQKVGQSRVKGIQVLRNKIVAEFAARAVFWGVRGSILKMKPDIILVSGISTPVAVQAALFKPKNCQLIYVDSNLPSELNQGNQVLKYISYGMFRFIFSSLINKKADKIIAAQEATAKLIKDSYGIHKKAVVISHGTDKDIFVFSEIEKQKIRKKLKVEHNSFIIITSGKIIPAKGTDLLFAATALLLKKYSDIYLVIVGDGPKEYRKKCIEFIPASKRDRVHVVGFQLQTSLPSYYSSADVAVWPLQESLAMNDAISCGLPVIVNNKIGVKERFSNKNALVYKQGDADDLALKIEYLYNNPDERRAMGQRGRDLVERKMSWLQKAKEYIQ